VPRTVEYLKATIKLLDIRTSDLSVTYFPRPLVRFEEIRAIETEVAFFADRHSGLFPSAVNEAISMHLKDYLVKCEYFYRQIEKTFADMDVVAAYTDTAGYYFGALLAHYSSGRGLATTVVCPQSFSFDDRNLASAYTSGQFAKTSSLPPGPARVVAQSPIAHRAIGLVAPDLQNEPIFPISWKPVRSLPVAAPSKPYTILFAPSFYEWFEASIWHKETSDEVIGTLAALAEAVRKTENLTLVVRMKLKSELDTRVLDGLRTRYPAVSFCGQAGDLRYNDRIPSFESQVEESLAVVSSNSTVIEGALSQRRPVILWGGRQRYRHVPQAKIEPGCRQAVYFPSSAELEHTIKHVASAHGDSALSDDELRAYCWVPNDPRVVGNPAA
jgi:hypothetical protein